MKVVNRTLSNLLRSIMWREAKSMGPSFASSGVYLQQHNSQLNVLLYCL